ncbi:MAG: threonine/serine dehydratase [Xanthobacteraceae bacterium]|nr:MAG: threonine/serine dehydratase [Xanthobacteraceae bacterium]
MNEPNLSVLPTARDVDAAAAVLAKVAVRTPLLHSPALDAMTGARLLFKPEMLQRTGSFKFRGAYNKIAAIPEAARGSGVVAFSSGNHAQGVAAAAQLFGMPATIVMPSDAPLSKRTRTQRYGAELVLYDRDREDREAIARRIAHERGAVLVPPFDDALIIAGQGTVGREIAEDMAARGEVPDVVIAPASGGGLMAGVALAVKARFPDARLVTAEPAGFDDHARSLKSRRREPHRAEGRTICDALMASIPGELTFAINRELVSQGVTATDAEVAAAMTAAFNELKLVVEPGGAVALAAVLAGAVAARGKTVVVVLSGGNVDADLYARLIDGTRKT